MTEVSGGLIRMTAHMVVTGEARGWMIAGAIVAGLFAALALCAALGRDKRRGLRYAAAFAALALAGAGMIYGGAKLPRAKVLYCCASGPVSLEQVAGRYEIIEVDGSFLKLVER